jgi:hypothetical protein
MKIYRARDPHFAQVVLTVRRLFRTYSKFEKIPCNDTLYFPNPPRTPIKKRRVLTLNVQNIIAMNIYS